MKVNVNKWNNHSFPSKSHVIDVHSSTDCQAEQGVSFVNVSLYTFFKTDVQSNGII